MELRTLTTKKEKQRFLRFRAELYKGDENYVCTENFVLTDVLFANTAFIRGCDVRPVAVCEQGKTVAQAILLYTPTLPYVQMGFFDALQDRADAVELLLHEAKTWKEQLSAKGVIVGLNGHISYGVGIQTAGFEHKSSFDSLYNKPYYADYFRAGRAQGLSTFKTELQPAIDNFPISVPRFHVRKCNLKQYRQEMELMRSLCEKTLSKTDLYFPTEKAHFYELTRDLKPFLKPENLLFAEDEHGHGVGFLFSHPDFNQMLEGGREYSLPAIGLSFLLNRRRIDTVKINAIGSVSPRATAALLQAFAEQIQGKYRFVETTFIWDNNRRSAAIAERTLGAPHKKYEVYYFYES